MIVARISDSGISLVAVCDTCEEDIVIPGAKVVLDGIEDRNFSIYCKGCLSEMNIKGIPLEKAVANLAANSRVPYSQFIDAFRKAWDELH